MISNPFVRLETELFSKLQGQVNTSGAWAQWPLGRPSAPPLQCGGSHGQGKWWAWLSFKKTLQEEAAGRWPWFADP